MKQAKDDKEFELIMTEADESAKKLLKNLRKNLAQMQSEMDGIVFNMERSMRMRIETNEHLEWTQKKSMISHFLEAIVVIALCLVSVYWIKGLLEHKLIV